MKTAMIAFPRHLMRTRLNRVTLAFLALIPVLHFFSVGWMERSRSVELILAGGDLNLGAVTAALAFILLRITAILLLPGFACAWLGLEALAFWRERKPAPITQ